MASPAIFKGRLTKFLTNGGILIPARPQTTDASAIPTPGELAYDTENENFVVYQNGDWEVVAVFDDLIASNIVNTPYGTIEAVTVQTALNELSQEKVERTGDSLTGNLTFATNTGIESTDELSTLNFGTNVNAHVVNIGTGDHTSTVNIGTGTGATTINIGGTGDTVAINGTLTYVDVTNLQVSDKDIVVNVGGAAASGNSAGLHVEEDGVITGYNHVANSRQSWELIAPANPGAIHLTPSTSAITTELKSTSITSRSLILPDADDTLATNTQITEVNTRIDDLTTDDVPELTVNPANLYFTDTRAKTAAVVNTVAGNETDQAPSVSSIVTYVNTEINALTTDDIEEGSNHKYFTTDRAQDAVGPAIELGTNVAGNPISASYSNVDDKIAITIPDASTTVRGAAVFSPDDFAVGGSGEIIVKAAGIGNAQLENSSITANGNEIALGDDVFVGIETINTSTSITAGTNRRIMVDTSGGAVEITLPSGSTNAYIELKDAVGSWDVNNLTITPAVGEKINGLVIDESLIADISNGWVNLAWDVTNSRWNVSTTAIVDLADTYATESLDGIVSTASQTFGGTKTFTDGIILEPNTTPVVNPTSGLQVYAKADNKLYTLTSGGLEQAVGSGGSIILVTQVAHGFTAADVGRPVYLNGSSYEFAQADTEAKAEVAGLISRIIGVDQFEVCLGGEVGSVGSIVDVSDRTYARSTVNSPYSGFLINRYLLDKLIQPENLYYGFSPGLAALLNDILIETPGNVAPAMNNPLSTNPGDSTNNNVSGAIQYGGLEYDAELVRPIELWRVNFSINVGAITLDSFEDPLIFNSYFSIPIEIPSENLSGQLIFSGNNAGFSFIELQLFNTVTFEDVGYFLEYPLEGVAIASLDGAPIPQMPIESSQNYFLSPTTPGALVSESPSVVGQISKPVGIARTTSALDFFNMRGSSVGGSNVYTQISLSNNATTTVQNVSAYDSVELAGWVYINATTNLRFHFKAQVTKKGDGTDYLVSFQTSGDTPPSGFDIDATSGGLVQVVMPSVAGFTSAIAQFSLNGPAVGASLPLQIESTSVSFSDIQAKDTNGISLKDSAGNNLINVTSNSIELLKPVTVGNAYEVELAGGYTAGTYYPIANSSNLPSGVYMVFIYQSTYLAGAAVYQFTWSYAPAAMFTYFTNTTESVAITLSSGAGHARNGVNAPSVRIRGTPNSDGKQYVDVAFPNTFAGLDGTEGKRVLVYFKRIA